MKALDKLVIGNGAGAVKTMADVTKACKSAATRIMVGSATLHPRVGNIGETYYYHPVDCWSLNTLGLPNMGMDQYDRLLPLMVEEAHISGKELWFSVAGFAPDEYADMTMRAFKAGVDGVELNLSCPNVWGKSGRKAIPAFDADMLMRIYNMVGAAIAHAPSKKRVSAKASPTDNYDLLSMFAATTAVEGFISEVVGFNTVGAQRRFRHDGKEALSFRSDESDTEVKHEGGLAGGALSVETPSRIKALCQMLPPSIPVIALGGIFNCANAFNNLEAGAQGFMCTTSYIEQGPGIFSSILEGLVDLAA